MDEVCRKRQLLENQQNRGIIEQSFFFGGIIVEVIKDKINRKTSSEVCKQLQNYSVRAGKTKFRRRKAHTASDSNSRNWGRSARVFHQWSWLKRCAISKLSAARTVFLVESAIVAPTLSVPNWLSFLPSFNSVLFIFVVKAFVCYIFFTKWKRIHFSGSKLFYIPRVSAATFFPHVRLYDNIYDGWQHAANRADQRRRKTQLRLPRMLRARYVSYSTRSKCKLTNYS